MKAKFLVPALMAGVALMATAAKDPVLMTINGKDVKLSEFEYLYHKNNQQQVDKESLDDYLERFIVYKLKVADAEAMHLDTVSSLDRELAGYKTDLVRPFTVDTTVKEQLINEAYNHMKTNVDIDHFMYPLGKDNIENQEHIARMDSLRQCILNGEDWTDVCARYSVDPSFKRNKGHYGYITAGVYPYEFEKVVYETPVGEISHPFRTDFGLHMIRVNGVRPDEGTVHAAHILRLFPQRGTPPTAEEKAIVKAKIDSIYQAVKAGADFGEMAIQYSEDPGSGKRGGDLGFFGRGRMVKPFEDMAYSLKDGEISEPFETSYGYHIVKVIEHKGVPTMAEARPTIEKQMLRDYRNSEPGRVRYEQVKKDYNYKENPKLEKYISSMVEKNGGYDSVLIAKLSKSTEPAFTFNNGKVVVPVSKLVEHANPKAQLKKEAATGYIMSFVDRIAPHEIMTYYVDHLIDDNTDYRNLINEYRDGLMLFEVSNRKVWEGASRDTTGLEKYFEDHRAKYAFDSPRFKGIILSAKGDSVFNAVNEDIDRLGLDCDTLTTALFKKYGRQIKMERMLVAKGENPAADYVIFNGPKPKVTKTGYTQYRKLSGELINAPEELKDVRGQVTSDYQDVLEKQWVADLKAKYPVKINKNVLKQVK